MPIIMAILAGCAAQWIAAAFMDPRGLNAQARGNAELIGIAAGILTMLALLK